MRQGLNAAALQLAVLFGGCRTRACRERLALQLALQHDAPPRATPTTQGTTRWLATTTNWVTETIAGDDEVSL